MAYIIYICSPLIEALYKIDLQLAKRFQRRISLEMRIDEARQTSDSR